MAEELKPCPHCWEAAVVEDARYHDGFAGDPREGTFYVRCMAGCLAMKVERMDSIAAWNRRVPSLDTANNEMPDRCACGGPPRHMSDCRQPMEPVPAAKLAAYERMARAVWHLGRDFAEFDMPMPETLDELWACDAEVAACKGAGEAKP